MNTATQTETPTPTPTRPPACRQSIGLGTCGSALPCPDHDSCARCGAARPFGLDPSSAWLTHNDHLGDAVCEPCDLALDAEARAGALTDTAAPVATAETVSAAVAREIDLLEHVQKGNVHILKIETRRAGWREGPRERNKKARVYFAVKGSSVLGAFALRGNEPHRAYRAFLPAVWAFLDAGRPEARPESKAARRARWSARAGCSMCPCSPGFILDEAPAGAGLSVYVTLEVG